MTLKEFKNSTVKDNAWQAVAKELGTNGMIHCRATFKTSSLGDII